MEPTIRSILSGGDRRSIGRANEALEIVREHHDRLTQVLECLFDPDPCLVMRAADMLEKLSRDQASLLQPSKPILLSLAAETKQKELRWHLALILPRLRLTSAECESVARLLEDYLNDRSSIVKTFALQGLADLTLQHPAFHPFVLEMIRSSTKTGTPAMRARGRHILKKLEADRA